mmetsp:Transcript_26329/g.105371  ORF Transcript_26329/g.105371 Transcript_26329/m.105371 type:complete len:170 (-) Transcript_26329:787-1296(-)
MMGATAAARRWPVRTVHRSLLTDPVVRNAGSEARDHLANERTFLAWARTGLGFVGFGTATFSAYHIADPTERGRDERHAHRILPACGLFIVNGAGLVAYAVYRYFVNERAISTGVFVVSKRSTVLVLAATTGLTTAALVTLYDEEIGRPRRRNTMNRTPPPPSQAKTTP